MYVEDLLVGQYMNHAIFVLNPQEKWPAHVTLAGPFSSKTNIPRRLSFIQKVSVLGRGRFLNGNRHTIYLNVGAPELSSRMHKPDFADAVPHLTLYNGTDADLANLLFDKLGKARIFGSFVANNLQVVESNSQFSADFALQVNLAIDPRTEGLSYNQVISLPLEQKVTIAIDSLKFGLQRVLSVNEYVNRLKVMRDLKKNLLLD